MGEKNQNVRCQNAQSVLSFSMYKPALHSYLAILFFPLSTLWQRERESRVMVQSVPGEDKD